MRQPKAIAHGIQQSKSLAIAQNAVPPVPLADEFENQRHSASPLTSVTSLHVQQGQRSHLATFGFNKFKIAGIPDVVQERRTASASQNPPHRRFRLLKAN